jgi:ankyrin repeat protein
LFVQVSPQAYLDAILESRGYSTKSYETLSSAYYNKSTPLQEASYDVHIVGVVKRGDAAALRELLATGISQNPSNNFGESFASLVCRVGSPELLKVLLEAGCDIQVADDYGRTPLHESCWAAEPSWPIVQMLLDRDLDLLYMTDGRASLPLAYVQPIHWGAWIQFLESKKDRYWPKQKAEPNNKPPALTLQKPNSRPVPDPKKALSIEGARLVASGRMSPEEAGAVLRDDDDGDADEYESDDEVNTNHDGLNDESIRNHNSYTDTDTDFDYYEAEMAGILQALDKQTSRCAMY